MSRLPKQPLLAIALALLVLGGSLWVIDPSDGLFSLFPGASAKESYQYANKPMGWNGPAGQCVVCHNLEKGDSYRIGPNLWGIVDAPKGGSKGFGYSHALATAGGTWTKQDLDRYLANPNQFLPGTNKTISGLEPQERAKIIAFLATLKD